VREVRRTFDQLWPILGACGPGKKNIVCGWGGKWWCGHRKVAGSGGVDTTNWKKIKLVSQQEFPLSPVSIAFPLRRKRERERERESESERERVSYLSS
jgi:hypothetical protein